MVEQMHEAEDVKDFPNDPRLKCYFKCLYVEWGAIKEPDPYLHLGHILDWMETLQPFHTKIYLDMGKGCKSKKKDWCEKMWDLAVCYKKNDFVVSSSQCVAHSK